MKIQIIRIGQEPTWELTQLIKEAKKSDHSISIEDFSSLNDIDRFNYSDTDAFIYRSTSLQSPLAKATILNALQAKAVINQAQGNLPFAAYKSFQYHYLARHTSIPIVPTFQFQTTSQLTQAIDDQVLQFPFVQKINFGGKGFDVSLIQNSSAIDISDARIPEYVYQNFIPNDHDFRVFVVGGKVLGIIKRTAPANDFRNNISVGGTSTLVTDTALTNQLIELSDQIISTLPFHIMGIDFIQHKDTGDLQLLEINTVPQWQGVQTATKVNVADHIIHLCESLVQDPTDRLNTIRQTFLDNLSSLTTYQQVHFVSRLVFFNILPDQKYIPSLELTNQAFFAHSKPDIIKLYNSPIPDLSTRKFSAYRQDIITKQYPKILNIHRLFDWATTTKHLHQQDTMPDILAKLNKNQLTEYYQPLMQNPDHILKLSTFAINYLYFITNANLLNDQTPIDLNYILDLINHNAKTKSSLPPELIIYLITHAIIGETNWYQKLSLPFDNISQQLITHAEHRIQSSYFQLSLDCKLEFLVACRLLNFSSSLEAQIMSEAKNSISNLDNYIVDQHNTTNQKSRRSFNASEHRNSLFCILEHYESK